MKKYLTKIICLLLSFSMLFGVMSAAGITAQAYTFGNDIVEYARDYIGCKYEYAHSGPDTFDCSGFVSYVFRNFGITLPRSSHDYWYDAEDYGSVIDYNSVDNAHPGDIISWYNSKAKHVAIYTGEGYVIEAANSRLGVVERQYDLIKANGDYKVIRIYDVVRLGVASNLTASKITGISANVKWNPVEYADGYLVQILTGAYGEWQNAGTTVTNEFNFRNNLTFGHNYSVRVKPYRYSNNEFVYGDSWSYSCDFSTLTKEQAAKSLTAVDYIRFSNAAQHSVDISYNAVAGANMYRIQCSADNLNWKTLFNTSNTYAVLSGLEADSLYYIRIVAYAQSGSDSAVSSRYSKSYPFYTSPAAEVSLISFEDLNDYQSYSGYVAYTSVYNSYIAGTNPPEFTIFSPMNSITRAMFVTILYRMAGNPYDEANPYEQNPFTDVSEGTYYYNAACWALDNEITNQTTFKPDDSVTREQTAKFLFAYAQANAVLENTDYKSVDLSRYPDYRSVHSWAVEPMQWANYNGMITGTAQGCINPQGDTQRIHATKILYRFGKTCGIGNFS